MGPDDGAEGVGDEDCVGSSSSMFIPSFQYWASEGRVELVLPFCLLGVGGGLLMNSWYRTLKVSTIPLSTLACWLNAGFKVQKRLRI